MDDELFEEPPARTPCPRRDRLYQDCPLLVRIWRRRHYIPIPFLTIFSWLRWIGSEDTLSLRGWWGFHTGMAQVKMLWIYPWNPEKEYSLEEVEMEIEGNAHDNAD